MNDIKFDHWSGSSTLPTREGTPESVNLGSREAAHQASRYLDHHLLSLLYLQLDEFFFLLYH
jgi:hypothetical protein